MPNKKINLSSSDIKDLKTSLETVRKKMDSLKKELPLKIAEDGLKYLDSLYASTPSDENIEDIRTSIKKTMNGYSIMSTGKDVIYAEFGTGDKGQANQHPDKGKYNLNEYNSGPTIRNVPDMGTMSAKQIKLFTKYNISPGKYWAYTKNGNLILTQGVPSGKQMFNTSKYLREHIKEVLEKEASDVLSKV